jgi:tRNA 5-methylaminomethyl-2-thiouridine biosynthesis bifunctional protein
MSDLDWTGGAPRSLRFDDVYFSAADGLAESRAVFLQGCALPEAWRGRSRFVVAELGFGSGLNILALLELWARTRPPSARLHVASVEGFPLTAEDAARALGAWPELAQLAAPLLRRWPQARGVHRIDWPELNATLDVMVGEVADALEGWDGRADAWFLDGFAPSRNPEMWRDDVLALVARRSAPGARLATFSVAGAVRRGLAAQGFAVEKQPGHGAKRERLEGRLMAPPSAPSAGWARRPSSAEGPVLVIGGGIAAASMVRSLAALGVETLAVSGEEPGASRFPAALVEPRLELDATPAARLHAQAFQRAVDVYAAEALQAILARGVLKIGRPEEVERFDRLAGSALFAPGSLSREAHQDGRPGLRLNEALVVEPDTLMERWLSRAERLVAEVSALEPVDGGWRLLDHEGRALAQSPTVVVAAGHQARRLLTGAPLQSVRGQVSLALGATAPAASWGGYVAPTRRGLLFGATHDRDDEASDIRPEDHQRNLATLAEAFPELAQQVASDGLMGAAGVRAATPDRLPIAGPVADAPRFAEAWSTLSDGRAPEQADPCLLPGLYVLGGLGSRGFTTAPLLAEHLAAWITGAPSPLPSDLAEAVHPTRFLVRALRRAGSSGPRYSP